MALQRAFADLHARLVRLHDALKALMRFVEDRPERENVVVAERLDDDVLAARGFVEEACAAANRARAALTDPLDRSALIASLVACQEAFHRFSSQQHGELASHDRLTDLATIGRERDHEWSEWVDVVTHGIEAVGFFSEAVRDELFACWQELLEHGGTSGVSIRNTSIGVRVEKKPHPRRDNRPARDDDSPAVEVGTRVRGLRS